MTKTEVIQRLQKDLKIPRFQAYIEDKDYSEEEYDQLKKDFETYFTNYVENVSADFEGGLDNKLSIPLSHLSKYYEPLVTCIR